MSKRLSEVPSLNGETQRVHAAVTAIGGYVPDRVVSNEELERRLGLELGWIEQRTGIRSRRYAPKELRSSEACVRAVHDLTTRYGMDLSDIDLVIAGGMTPDDLVPGTACRVQNALGLRRAGAFDIQAACASFMHALHVAEGLVVAGSARKVLVVCGELASHIVDPCDRATVAVFGDGAGAVVVEAAPRSSFRAHTAGTDGSSASWLHRPDPMFVNRDSTSSNGPIYLHMQGREIYRWVIDTMPTEIECLLERAGLDIGSVDWFVPHGANARMLAHLCDQIELPKERMLTSLERHGNTGAASIPLALVHGVETGRLQKDQTLLAFGFGAGLSFAGSVLEWTAS